jgi:tetratricopeptide (TPR) repeat protein
MRIALVFVFGALACCASAQDYKVGPEAAKSPQAPPAQTQAPAKQSQAPGQQLGFGSNIENARLARAAVLALQHGDRVHGLDFARRAAEGAPGNPKLWFLVGYAARLNGRFEESVEHYNRGLKVDPSSLEGHSGLAQTFAEMGRTQEAQQLLQQVVATDPRRRSDVVLLGELYMRLGDFDGALVRLLSAERMKPEARSELLLAMSYQRLKRMDQANHYLEMAEKRSPDNPEVMRAMAGYYRDTGDFARAIAKLKAIKNPKPDVVVELAYIYQLAGNFAESARIYAQAANAAPKDLTLQLSAAQAQVLAGTIEKADAFLKRAAAIDPNFYRLHSILGEIAKLQEHDQDALREYKTALANMPKEPTEGPLLPIQLHINLMDIYKDLQDQNGAKSELEIAQAGIKAVTEPETGNLRIGYLRLRAVIKLSGGDFNGALGDMKEALAINPKDRDSLQLDGDVLMKLGRAQDAIVVYKQILALDANNRSALTSLGFASRVAGLDKDAEKYFLRLAQVYPTYFVPYAALGDLYTARRDFPKAQANYDKAYSLTQRRAMIQAGGINASIEAHDLTLGATWMSRVTPEMKMDPQILRESERYLSFKGDYQGSAETGRQAIKILPHDRDVVIYLGYDLVHLEKWDELLALTTQYWDVFPKEPDIPLLQGYVHKHAEQNDEALADFNEALKRDPNVVTAFVNRGFTLNDLHKAKAAVADFEAAIKREPDNGEAHLGLAYSSLDLHKSQAALGQSVIAEKILGDSKEIHVIRATAYGQESMLLKAEGEYRAALKFAPDDGVIHLGLGNVIFSERHYHQAIDELQTAAKDSPDNPEVYALMARSYAALSDRNQTIHYVQQAEQLAEHPADPPPGVKPSKIDASQIYVSTGEALNTLGDHQGAMDRFSKALSVPKSDRVAVRLAIAHLMAEQEHTEDGERQVALAQMESEAGETEPPTGTQYVAAADVLRDLHDFPLAQTYLDRAKQAGAPDAQVKIGLADNYLAEGDTVRAEAQLAAVTREADQGPDYQFLLAQANVYRQEHREAQALTAFGQATSVGGEDPSTEQSLLAAGADEGLRITPMLSMLSDTSVEAIFEDSTVYVLDSKLDASFPIDPSNPSLLPPPRSSLEWQNTDAFHLHVNHLPTVAGFFQVRNARGEISVPATNSIQNRDTTDWNLNAGMEPTLYLGSNVVQFNAGIQGTIRRDANLPTQLNQNLFRQFAYVSTSSFFNVISASGYVLHETGPFTETSNHSSSLTGAVDFKVGVPWGNTKLLTGWGSNDQKFSFLSYESYFTDSYVGLERRFDDKLDVKALAEDIRAWRLVSGRSGIAQSLRPAATVDFTPNHRWEFQLTSAYSSARSFHVYDQIQNAFSVTYAKPFHHKFNDDSGEVVLEYPIRFSAGFQEQSFFNFPGTKSEQFRPYVRISLF